MAGTSVPHVSGTCSPLHPLSSSPFSLRRRLRLEFASIGGCLPIFRPGAVALLAELHLLLPANKPCPLPPAWAAPGALPALRTLIVRAPLTGPLPREWASGLPSLISLRLEDTFAGRSRKSPGTLSGGDLPGPDLPPEQQQQQQRVPGGGWPLPPEWAAGFHALHGLDLLRLHLTGPIPQPWVDGGFPSLVFL